MRIMIDKPPNLVDPPEVLSSEIITNNCKQKHAKKHIYDITIQVVCGGISVECNFEGYSVHLCPVE